MRTRVFPVIALIPALLAANWLALRLPMGGADTLPPSPELAALAERHAPAIWQPAGFPGGPLREMLWEARREADGRLSILYRTVWDDEVHPNALAHHAYALFRRLYYGGVTDVEYVRVELDAACARVEALDFQTDGHERVLVPSPEGALALRVRTWNHLLERAPPRFGDELQAPALRPLAPADRDRLRLGRRTYAYLKGFGERPFPGEVALLAGAVVATAGGAWGRMRLRRRNMDTAPRLPV